MILHSGIFIGIDDGAIRLVNRNASAEPDDLDAAWMESTACNPREACGYFYRLVNREMGEAGISFLKAHDRLQAEESLLYFLAMETPPNKVLLVDQSPELVQWKIANREARIANRSFHLRSLPSSGGRGGGAGELSTEQGKAFWQEVETSRDGDAQGFLAHLRTAEPNAFEAFCEADRLRHQATPYHATPAIVGQIWSEIVGASRSLNPGFSFEELWDYIRIHYPEMWATNVLRS